MSSESNVHIFQSVEQLNKSVATLIVKAARDAISKRGSFCISLSGGNTPQKLYALLAGEQFQNSIDWQKTHVFWGDERCLPLDDERNNAHEAKLILLNRINIPSENVHIIPVNYSPAEAAKRYNAEIISFFGDQPKQFDLMLLGLGENGHTASLFPHTDVIHEKLPGVKAVYLEDQQMFRVTMTAPLINASRLIFFLVTGKEKAETVKNIIHGDYMPEEYPAQLINASTKRVSWFLDEGAASLINIEKQVSQTKISKDEND
jgi:6-phosphogluconolactonase